MLFFFNIESSATLCKWSQECWYLSVTKTYPRLSVAFLSLASSSLACDQQRWDKKKKKKLAQCADFVLRFSPAVSDLADKLRWLCVRTQSHLVLLQDCVLHAWSCYFQTELLLCAPKEAMEACCEECTFHLVTVACCFLFLISTREWSCVNAKCGSFWATYFYVYWLVLPSAAQCPEQTTYCVTFM